jgi:septal ring factor EnvC (AmiA/AmiB activator)
VISWNEIIANAVGVASLIVAILLLRHGPGYSRERLRETIKLSIQDFSDSLDTKLDDRFEKMASQINKLAELHTQIETLRVAILKDIERIDSNINQLDQQVSRVTQQTDMLIHAVLKSGLSTRPAP